MNLAPRTILILTLLLGAAERLTAQEATSTAAAAQETATATATTTATTTTTNDVSDEEGAAEGQPAESARNERAILRDRFTALLGQHPDSLSRLLYLDPSLLSNDAFLAKYPDLAQFVAENPDIRRNPHYFVRVLDVHLPRRESPLEEVMEALSIMFAFALVAAALAWIIRTIIEQKRWNQLSRRQSDVHNKILDRFNNSEELLAYIKTPAGTKFLESAPIPLHAAPARQMGSQSRIAWSIQIGIIVAAAGLGMLLVSLRLPGESGQGLFAMGVIAFCTGGGFIASALVSILLSKRFPLGEGPEGTMSARDEPGVMR